MKINLIRSREVSEERFMNIVRLIQKNLGPVTFVEHNKPVEINDHSNDEVKSWESLFSTCDEFRQNNKGGKFRVKEEDVVVLLTDFPNENNWFSAWQPDSRLNFFVQTSMWENYLALDSVYPVVYELISIPLYIMLCATNTELMDMAHYEKQEWGCAFDMCQYKPDIIRKLMSGDLCPSCKKLIKEKTIDIHFQRQFFDTIEMVRSKLLFFERSNTIDRPSELKVNIVQRKLYFNDLGDTSVKLSPRGFALYFVLLRDPDVKYYTDIKKYTDTIVYLIKNKSIEQLAENETKTFIDTPQGFREVVNEINTKLDEKLGDNSKFYRIEGSDKTGRNIKINRDLVSFVPCIDQHHKLLLPDLQ